MSSEKEGPSLPPIAAAQTPRSSHVLKSPFLNGINHREKTTTWSCPNLVRSTSSPHSESSSVARRRLDNSGGDLQTRTQPLKSARSDTGSPGQHPRGLRTSRSSSQLLAAARAHTQFPQQSARSTPQLARRATSSTLSNLSGPSGGRPSGGATSDQVDTDGSACDVTEAQKPLTSIREEEPKPPMTSRGRRGSVQEQTRINVTPIGGGVDGPPMAIPRERRHSQSGINVPDHMTRDLFDRCRTWLQGVQNARSDQRRGLVDVPMPPIQWD